MALRLDARRLRPGRDEARLRPLRSGIPALPDPILFHSDGAPKSPRWLREMTQARDRCFVCGTEARGDEPTVPEEYFTGLWCHLSCLNSSEGIAWRKERTRTDPGYARYLRH